jgi:hypothetical protein
MGEGLMAIVVVTSCSLEGWEKYGKKFLTSFDQFWPHVQLHIVSEDRLPLPDSILSKRPEIRLWDLDKSGAAVVFANKYKEDPVANGFKAGSQIASWRSKKTGYDYRRDAFRFSKKVFALNLVLPSIADTDRLIWLDADTVTLKDIPLGIFDDLPPSQYAIAYLDRHPYHSECGFVGYNLRHPATRPFLKEFSCLYSSDSVFLLDEWHDSYVFDWLRKRLRVPSFPIPYDRRHITHPFVYSKLGEYMDHLKGMRKQRGVSHDHPRFHGRGKQGKQPGRVGVTVRYVRHQAR